VAGDDTDAKDESLMWDVTKAQACVERLLQLFPKMTPDKARSLLEVVCGDHIDDSEVLQTTAANATLAKVFGDPRYTEAKNAGGDSLNNFLQRGLERRSVVHPGAPESQCVYKIRQFAGSFGALTLRIG
jgi:hypothetical protein